MSTKLTQQQIAALRRREEERREGEVRAGTPTTTNASLVAHKRIEDPEEELKSVLRVDDNTPLFVLDYFQYDRRPLGRGGFSTVFKALEPIVAAVKEFNSEVGVEDDPEYVDTIDRFRREYRTLRDFSDHPQIPNFLGIGARLTREGDRFRVFRPGLVMEYIEGQTYADKIFREEGSSPEEVRDVLMQTLNPLEELHTRRRTVPVMHRDIKPANLKRNPDGVLYLLDFGLVRDEMVLSTMGGNATMHAGTMGYIHSEQADGRPNERTDLYSLGRTLYAISTMQELRSKAPISVSRLGRTNLDPQMQSVIEMLCDEDLKLENIAQLRDYLNPQPIEIESTLAEEESLDDVVEAKPIDERALAQNRSLMLASGFATATGLAMVVGTTYTYSISSAGLMGDICAGLIDLAGLAVTYSGVGAFNIARKDNKKLKSNAEKSLEEKLSACQKDKNGSVLKMLASVGLWGVAGLTYTKFPEYGSMPAMFLAGWGVLDYARGIVELGRSNREITSLEKQIKALEAPNSQPEVRGKAGRLWDRATHLEKDSRDYFTSIDNFERYVDEGMPESSIKHSIKNLESRRKDLGFKKSHINQKDSRERNRRNRMTSLENLAKGVIEQEQGISGEQYKLLQEYETLGQHPDINDSQATVAIVEQRRKWNDLGRTIDANRNKIETVPILRGYELLLIPLIRDLKVFGYSEDTIHDIEDAISYGRHQRNFYDPSTIRRIEKMTNIAPEIVEAIDALSHKKWSRDHDGYGCLSK
ncbi:protein kinase [archaeon]|jgi:serine/threonine protein kinase|nr:protein kinase [archaeon]MBT4416689.1 protein kinase [archaeon]